MKTTTLLTSFLILAALTAFVAGPVTAEDEPPPHQPPPAERAAEGDGPRGRGPIGPGPERPDPGEHHAAMSFRVADTNRDRSVSAAEWKIFQEAQDKAFRAADKDGDGALAAEEMPRLPPRRESGAFKRRGPQEAGRRGPPPPPQEGRADLAPPRGRRGPDGPPPPRGRPADREPEQGRPAGMGPPEGQRSPRAGHRQGPGAQRDRRPNRKTAADRPALGRQIERLTAALEKLLEQLESRPPR